MTRPRDIADGINRIDTSAADATAITIDSNENVGIGTSSPVVSGTTAITLQTKGTASSSVALIASSSNDGGSSVSLYSGQNSSDNPAISYQNDLRFGTSSDAGVGSFSEKMRIDSSGNVLRYRSGTTDQYLHLTSVGGTQEIESVKNSLRLSVDPNSADAGSLFMVDIDGSERMRIDSSGNLLVGTTTSGGSGGVTLRNDGVMIAPAVYGTVVSASLRDIQMDSSGFFGYSTSTRATKGNIEDLSDVSWLYNLNPVSFNRKVNGEELSPELEYGLIAEDVEEVNADLCFYNETDNGKELAGITYSKLITPLLKALQEANAKIETLEAKVTALENANG